MTGVTIERWTRDHRSAFTRTAYTLIYADPKTGPHRISTRGTEDAARAFAERHGWTVTTVTADTATPAPPTRAAGGRGVRG